MKLQLSARVRSAALLLGLASAIALAQPAAQRVAPAQDGPAWHQLSNAERSALGPLQRDWSSIDAERKQKWREVAARFPSMPEDERARVQGRMSEWARMTPQERGQARLRYRQAQGLAPEERQARWEAYQALTADQRKQLANQTPANGDAQRRAGRADARVSRGDRQTRQSKPNIVPNPAYAAPPKQVAPSVVQAKPGASTTLISKRPAPPPHQQTGLPKIAAQPGFVDRDTLLPQRGAQGAATRPAKTARDESADRPRTR